MSASSPTVFAPALFSGLLCASLRPPTSALSLDKDELGLPARLPGSLLDCGLQEGRELWFPAAEVSELPGRYITSAGRMEGWTDEWKTAKHSRAGTALTQFPFKHSNAYLMSI